jgi:hypothetical protein
MSSIVQSAWKIISSNVTSYDNFRSTNNQKDMLDIQTNVKEGN